MKKIFLSIILSATFLLSSVPTFAAQPVYYYYYTYENPYFTYNGTAYETDMYACNGEVMIPLRTYAEIFDGTIAWFAPTQTVSLTIGDNYYEMSEGNNYIKINDTTGYLVMSPQIINDKLCVPFRQFSEITGNVVAFDIENRSFAMETAPKTVSIEKQTGTRLVSVNYKGDIIDGKYEIQKDGKLVGYAYYENGEEIKRTTASKASDTPEDNFVYNNNYNFNFNYNYSTPSYTAPQQNNSNYADYEAACQQAYIDYMMARKNLAQKLSAQGLGVSESSYLQLQLQYEDKLIQLQRQYGIN